MSIYDQIKRSFGLLSRSGFRYYRMAMVNPPYRLSVNGRSCIIFAPDSQGSRTCYGEVIGGDCYKILKYSKVHKPSVIVDIGANIGIFSKLCSLLFLNADIYAYEPNPEAFTWLEKNAEKTNIQVFNCAISENSGIAMLDTQCDSTVGRICQEGNLPVRCLQSSEVAQGFQIDLLKIDCEGSEWSILQDSSLLDRTKYLCLEYHLYDKHTLQEMQEIIEKSNHKVKYIDPHPGYNGKFGLIWSVHV